MKMKSISGVVYYVKDLDKTAAFYEELGFRFGKREAGYLTCYLNWFWLEFHAEDKEHPAGGVGGQQLGISVEDADEFYQGLIEKGLKPEGEPETMPWGRREFTLRDPDGNQLVFFHKK